MRVSDFENLVRALNSARVEYIVVGGVAVVIHGYGRVTFDLDIVIRLRPSNIHAAFRALDSLGYRPRIRLTADEFADERQREVWIRKRGMTVLTFHSDRQPMTPVDIFAQEPFDFDSALKKAFLAHCEGGDFYVVDLNTLKRMKRTAGRPKDLDDILQLERLSDERA